MRVLADREICIGAGMCVMTADAVFDQDDDGIVVLLAGEGTTVPADLEKDVRTAVGLCPSGALQIAPE